MPLVLVFIIMDLKMYYLEVLSGWKYCSQLCWLSERFIKMGCHFGIICRLGYCCVKSCILQSIIKGELAVVEANLRSWCGWKSSTGISEFSSYDRQIYNVGKTRNLWVALTGPCVKAIIFVYEWVRFFGFLLPCAWYSSLLGRVYSMIYCLGIPYVALQVVLVGEKRLMVIISIYWLQGQSILK